MPAFEWDPEKARINLGKHGVAFEDAVLVWSDPLHLVRFDRREGGEERWHALGMAGGVVLLLVVHTYPGGEEDRVRLVSARRATRAERRAYEDGSDQ
ncbi:BrnT family toxin [Roseomonas mucosa]|uniref:BrnT family toxin n=1 Tax=Roseomonas mucosa TaxID=207340 RepID=UPI0028CC731E|nr:BrnT family toxin [Roseomonas mucosa]MDT8316235.1 BrnT family toxin [Roseomonas mucosa]MDT8362928.1 BrnT family toxin [Roseomonas mucosa]